MSNLTQFLGRKPVVFFVDDEKEILEIFEMQFVHDFELKCFSNPESLIQEVAAMYPLQPDVVVTDYRMPQMDGIQMLQSIKKNGSTVRSVLLSGNLDKESAIDAANSGVFRILQKPFNAALIQQSIEDVILQTRAEKIRTEMKDQMAKMKELYTSLRTMLGSRVPEFDEVMQEVLVDPGHGADVIRFEDVLLHMETKFDELMTAENTIENRKRAVGS